MKNCGKIVSAFVVVLLVGCKEKPNKVTFAPTEPVIIEGLGDPNVGEFPALPGGIVATEKALSLKAAKDQTAFPRLSHSQWENAIREVFQLDAGVKVVKNDFPVDNTTTSFPNDSASMEVTNTLLTAYATAADNLVEVVVKGGHYRKLIPSNAPAGDTKVRAAAIVAPILKRAYKRMPTAAEIEVAAVQFTKAKTILNSGSGDEAGFQSLVYSIVLSPNFIYRPQLGSTPVSGISKLTADEVAIRLASALWESVPDDDLLTAAANGSLLKPAGLTSQVDRMLASPKSKAALENFHLRLFGVRKFADIDRSDKSKWTPELKKRLQDEARAFFNEVVINEKAGLTQILTAPYAFVSDLTAGFYGVPSPGPVPKKTALDPSKRRGFFSQVGFLAINANDSDSSIIRRGAHLSEYLVCKHSVQTDAPESPLPIDQSRFKTQREAVAASTDGCGLSCHKPLINPIGFAFENFDNSGIYRTMDKSSPINAAGVLGLSEGREVTFNNAPEFVDGLSKKFETHRCYISKMIQYVYGRRENMSDVELINNLAKESLEGKSTIELFKELVSDPSMLQRPSSK